MRPLLVIILIYSMLGLALALIARREHSSPPDARERMEPAFRRIAGHLPLAAAIDIYGSGTPAELLLWSRWDLAPRNVEGPLKSRTAVNDTVLLVFASSSGPDSVIRSLTASGRLLYEDADSVYRYLLIRRNISFHATP